MKLLILNTTMSTDNDFFKLLASQAGIEVITVAPKDIDIVKKYDTQPVTEVHIVGGVLPQYDLTFYSQLFSAIHKLDRLYHLGYR